MAVNLEKLYIIQNDSNLTTKEETSKIISGRTWSNLQSKDCLVVALKISAVALVISSLAIGAGFVFATVATTVCSPWIKAGLVLIGLNLGVRVPLALCNASEREMFKNNKSTNLSDTALFIKDTIQGKLFR